VQNLTTTFRSRHGVARAVNNVSFKVGRGRTLGIVGESGSGKSVTLMSIVRLVAKPAGQIEHGAILLDGVDLLTLSDEEMRRVRGAKISVVTQDPMTSLNPVYTIGNQLEEPLRLHQGIKNASELKRRITAALARVGIPAPETRIKNYPHQLSGGQRQRVVTAMALECHPALILCDEPTTALDVTIQLQVLKLLRDLQREFKLGMILVSHDLGAIARVCDDVAVMYAGQIVETAPLAELFERPSHPYTKALMRSLNAETESNGRLYSIDGQPPDIRKLGPGCAFAPRCREARDICQTEQPPDVSVSAEHRARCWAVVEARSEAAPAGAVP
jgi:oligopeptide transport system ATP-binding protein